MIFLYKLLQIVEIKKVFYISIILYLFKSLTYAYSWINIPGIEIVKTIWDSFSGIFDGVCLALPFMGIGVLAARKDAIYLKISQYRKIGAIISFGAIVLEASLLRFFSFNSGNYSYIIFTFPVCMFLFSCVLEKKTYMEKRKMQKIRKYSTLLFCVHPLVIYVCQLNNIFNQSNSFIQYICVLMISLLVSKLIVFLSEKENGKMLIQLY